MKRGASRSLVWTPSGRNKYVLTDDVIGGKHTLTRLSNIVASDAGEAVLVVGDEYEEKGGCGLFVRALGRRQAKPHACLISSLALGRFPLDGADGGIFHTRALVGVVLEHLAADVARDRDHGLRILVVF